LNVKLVESNASALTAAQNAWTDKITTATTERDGHVDNIGTLTGETQAQAGQISTLNNQITALDELIKLRAAEKVTQQGVLDDMNEQHPLDQAAKRTERDDLIEDHEEEETNLQTTYDDKVTELDDALEKAINDLQGEWATKTAEDVAAATARDDDTVFEVCTRIDRDPETPGEFRVETVHHGDVHGAASAIQKMMENQQLQLASFNK